jgi:hypothetical protein
MLKLVKACAPWLTWKVGLVAVLGIVVLASFDKLLGLAVLAGATPILAVLACLIPCLIPLVLLRKKKAASLITQADTKSASCNYGGDSCQMGENPHSRQNEMKQVSNN